MGNNQIRFLHSGTFATLSSLKNISIAFNQLESTDESLLENNRKLEWIWLENKFRSIEAKVFDDKQSLVAVDLRGSICIDGFFYSSSFAKMKNEIEEKCPSCESLNECSERFDNFKAQLISENKEFAEMKDSNCKQITESVLNSG
jgi:hypothetical protein